MMAAVRHSAQGMTLHTLFAGLVDTTHLPDIRVSGLALDSRCIAEGELFLACAGTAQHGVHFIEQAIARGAVAVAVEPAPESAGMDLDAYSIPAFWVERLHLLASEVAGRFYGDGRHYRHQREDVSEPVYRSGDRRADPLRCGWYPWQWSVR